MIYTIYKEQISIFHNDNPFSIPKEDSRFEKVKALLLENKFFEVEKLIEYNNLFTEKENLSFKDNVLYYREDKLPVILSDLIIECRLEEKPYTHYVQFFNTLKYNKDFVNNETKRKSFYRKLKNVYVLDDFVIYDADSKLDIENFYELKEFPQYFQALLVKNCNVKETIENISGIKSDKFLKKFKEEVFSQKINVKFINWVSLLKGICDPNFLYEGWESNKEKMMIPYPQALNKFISGYKNHPKSVANFINNSSKNAIRILSSLVLEIKDDDKIILPDFSSIDELNPILSREISRKNGSFFLLNLEETYPLLKDLCLNVKEGIEIVIPQSNLDLHEWSNRMNNCISTFAQNAKKGRSLLLGVNVDGDLKYNIEISGSGCVQQFQGKHNARALDSHRKIVEEHLKLYKIIK